MTHTEIVKRLHEELQQIEQIQYSQGPGKLFRILDKMAQILTAEDFLAVQVALQRKGAHQVVSKLLAEIEGDDKNEQG